MLIPSTKFECCWVRVSQSDVEWYQFYDQERTETMKVSTFKMECGDSIDIVFSNLFMTA